MVFTSKPVNGLVSHKVSDTNIKGECRPQYIVHNIHSFDPSLHEIKQTNECISYNVKNKKELLSHEQKLQMILEITEK